MSNHYYIEEIKELIKEKECEKLAEHVASLIDGALIGRGEDDSCLAQLGIDYFINIEKCFNEDEDKEGEKVFREFLLNEISDYNEKIAKNKEKLVNLPIREWDKEIGEEGATEDAISEFLNTVCRNFDYDYIAYKFLCSDNEKKQEIGFIMLQGIMEGWY